jgi:Fe-S cluster biogenesis protein NfuA
MISNEFEIEPTISKFIIKLVSKNVLTNGSHQFNSQEAASESPLAKHLLSFSYIKKVYISVNFIALECSRTVDWGDHQEEVKQEVISFLGQGGALFTQKSNAANFIEWYTESTPNSAVLKFVASKLLFQKEEDFTSVQDAKNSDLATGLFNLGYVAAVFFSQNFVSVTKKEKIEWMEIKDELKQFIKNYLQSNQPLINNPSLDKKKNQAADSASVEVLDSNAQQIVAILEEHIRPLVASDGGSITFREYNPTTKIVSLLLQGACSGCPSSSVTLKEGIEKILKQLMPGKINEVIAYNR